MEKRGVICVCLLAIAALASASVEEESVVSDVLVLDVNNFTETVEKYDFLVVEFYAPWCGHCKKLAPEYDVAATTLKSHDPPISLAKVDVNEEANKPLAAKFDVRGFPTLKIFRNKGTVVQEYKGPREAYGIISYLKKLTGPPSVELESADQAAEFLSENEKEITLIGLFKTLEGEEYVNFIEVAETLRSEYVFGHTVDPSYVPDHGVPLKTPSVRLHKSFDEKIAVQTDFTVESLLEFIETESFPLVTVMSRKPELRPALTKFIESSKDKVFFLLAKVEAEGEDEVAAVDESSSLLSSFTKDAKIFKEKGIIFLISHAEESGSALQYFGVTESDLPAYVIQSSSGKKYISRNVKSEELAPWLEDFLEGKLKEHVKSEPIPLTNDEPVKVVVANTLKSFILESGKDVFLEFYAPWCGHCKKLAPVLDEVAVSFESDPEIMIAKFDASNNDIPSDLFAVEGFPTLYFYSASGVVTPFDGERTKEGITDFINANRSKKSSGVRNEVPEVLTEVVIETVDVKDEL